MVPMISSILCLWSRSMYLSSLYIRWCPPTFGEKEHWANYNMKKKQLKEIYSHYFNAPAVPRDFNPYETATLNRFRIQFSPVATNIKRVSIPRSRTPYDLPRDQVNAL